MLNFKKTAQIVSLIIVSIFSLGCTAVPQQKEQVSVFYGESIQSPVLEGESLRVANLKLTPWHMPVPQCENCGTSVQRYIAPSGTSQIIKLVKDQKLAWAFYDVRRTSLNTSIGSLQIDDAVVTLTNSEQGVISLKLGQSTQLKGCTLTYLWRNEPYPVKKGVSNENPKAHVQLLYDCL